MGFRNLVPNTADSFMTADILRSETFLGWSTIDQPRSLRD